jgi:predicted amidohydrolase
VDVDGLCVSVNICYDLQFDDGARAAGRAGARVLACPCNNMIRREAAEQWKLRHNEIRTLRAREANLWVVSSDVTGERDGRVAYGPTAVIDPLGRVRTQVPLLTEGVALWEVDGGVVG